jgi:hypothetical protein
VNIMKADDFRNGREEVERILGGVEEEIKDKFVLEPDRKIEQAQQIVDGLAEGAGDEIQNRSVNNMNLKIRLLKGRIEKLPARKNPVKKRAAKK